MAQVLEASVLGALLYLGLGELGQQNCSSQVVRRQRMEHEGCRGWVYPRPHPQEPTLVSQVYLLDICHFLLLYIVRISQWMDP